ncbi:MAG: oxidoreductase [Dehalococcoidia bacterium]|nr:MAG: oxidoreductase [Dehalococcoidia bacterium]
MEPVRFAIVSPARWGRLLLDAARETPMLSFAGVASGTRSNADAVAHDYGGRVYPSYEALLADPTIEAILLPTPHHLHYPQAMAAFAAGKHVFVEKPIAVTIAEAETMQQESERRGLVLAVDHPGRRTGGARLAKRLIDEGRLGAIVSAVAIHGAPLEPRSNEDWKFSAEVVPGGPLDQLGPHYADLMHYLLGPIRNVSSYVRDDVTPFSAPDAAIASFRFASGVIGVYVTHQVAGYVSSLTIFGVAGALRIERFGQELFWQDRTPTQAAQAGEGGWRPIPVAGPAPSTTALTEALDEFARCIRTGARAEVGAAEGIAALRVMRAALDSAQIGRVIELAVEQ